MLKLLSATLLLSIGLASAVQSQDFTRDVLVDYVDLDLGKRVDIKRLDHRIARAIKQVCPDNGDANLGARVAIRDCRTAKYAEIATYRESAINIAQGSKLAAAVSR